VIRRLIRPTKIQQGGKRFLNCLGSEIAEVGSGKHAFQRLGGSLKSLGLAAGVYLSRACSLDNSDQPGGSFAVLIGMLSRLAFGQHILVPVGQVLPQRPGSVSGIGDVLGVDHPRSNLGGIGLRGIGHLLGRSAIRATSFHDSAAVMIDIAEIPGLSPLDDLCHHFPLRSFVGLTTTCKPSSSPRRSRYAIDNPFCPLMNRLIVLSATPRALAIE
jgi:hypothetical protein